MRMTREQFQVRLKAMGYDIGRAGPRRDGVDGDPGALTKAAFMAMMTDGPDTPIRPHDLEQALATLRRREPSMRLAHVQAVVVVESTGKPVVDGRPTILPEPHRFSRSTAHRYDRTHGTISSLKWNPRLYPVTQLARYEMLWQMVKLDPWAGFASASYGAFQVLGENHLAAGFADPMAFARAHALTVGAHLAAFVGFVMNTPGMSAKLAACKPGDPRSCEPFCAAYNGTAFRVHNYHGRFAATLARYA